MTKVSADIELFGDLKETRAQIMRVVTDSTLLEAPKNHWSATTAMPVPNPPVPR